MIETSVLTPNAALILPLLMEEKLVFKKDCSTENLDKVSSCATAFFFTWEPPTEFIVVIIYCHKFVQ